MGVAESRFGDVVDDNIIVVNGYSSIRQDRNTQGGGIVLYIRNYLRATVLAHSNTTTIGKTLIPEYLMYRITGEGIPSILVCLIYRPPVVSFDADPLFMSNLSTSYSHKIIMGDLNADLLADSTVTLLLRDLVDELLLQIVDHGTTRRPHGSSDPKTWIDIICVDNNDTVFSFNNKVPPFITDLNLIDVEIEVYVPKPPEEAFSYRKFKDIAPEDINEFLAGCDWGDFETKSFDVDTAVTCLNNNIQAAIDKLAPLRTINSSKNKKKKYPWIDPELSLLINKRKATERRYLRSKNPLLAIELLKLTEEIESSSKTAHNVFLHNRLEETLDNNQDIWREMRNLGLLPSPKNELHGFSPNDINAYFAGVSFSPTENLDDISELIDYIQ